MPHQGRLLRRDLALGGKHHSGRVERNCDNMSANEPLADGGMGMEERFTPGEEAVVLKCPKCSTENPSDSIFCRICSTWLVRQWEGVIVKGRAPIHAELKVGAGRPVSVIRRRFMTKTDVKIQVDITGGGRRDIIAYVRDPNGNIIAGNEDERLSQSGQLSFQTYVPGDYELLIDNSFSRFISKVLKLTVQGF